ncbi:MAG: prepilin-type N-terminal cleavage/methylation domain-containing protein, partial [Patescibacteria group bacterium]
MQHFPVTARGFSLIELLFAGALLSVFSFGVVQILAYSLEADRLGQEQSFATQYATEGIEATRSIRARDFDAIVVASESGLAVSEGEWTFSDSNNTDG